ncbi:MAG: sugar ABC transporter substrate-binding protein [Planctomycetota bacterium]|jgi:ribose transport system substrate-binding protein|nr:sugar ABC transporter substrate-binding protein [Planctomycetota bacterium]
MRYVLAKSLVVVGAVMLFALAGMAAEGKKLSIGMVSIDVNDSGNARAIRGATEEAERLGWDVIVIDGHGSPDEANAAIENLVLRGVDAIIDLVFPITSLGSGLRAAAEEDVKVGTWGGGYGEGVVVTSGSGGIMARPIVEQMVKDMGGKGSVLALTYHTGQVARERELVLDEILVNYPDITVTKNEVRIPGYLQDGAEFASAWLSAHPEGNEPLAIWGSWDDPALGAIASMRQQDRHDVKVYGQNGNIDAVVAVESGWMTATAWEQSEVEGAVLVQALKEAIEKGKDFPAGPREVPVIVVNQESIAGFIKEHPEAAGR